MSTGNVRYDALAVDPDMQRRIKIKQATTAVTTFHKFYQAGELEEALQKLAGPDPIDVVFVSNRYEFEQIASFIKRSKETKFGQDAAFVIITRTEDELAQVFGKNLVLGADGFLAEPYSVESLDEITKLAARIKKERQEAREEAAIRFLMKQISDQISIIAQLKSHGMNPVRETRKLHEMCDIFKSLDDAGRQRYHRIASEIFENAPLPKPIKGKVYGGASARVKKKMEQKIVAQLQADTQDNAAPSAPAPAAEPTK